MPSVVIRCYEELNDFLPRDKRGLTRNASFSTGCTAKALIEDIGVPHTEVDLILANGQSVPFSYKLRDGDRLSIYPVFEAMDIAGFTRLRPAPLRRLAFVLDVHLGKLARLLRMMGFDAAYDASASDEEIALLSVEKSRAILTRDRGLLKRSIVTHGYCVRSSAPAEQLEEVLRRFDCVAAVSLFTRCLECNEPLRRVDPREVRGRVPDHIAVTHNDFSVCGKCDRIFWQGTHWEGMKKLAAETLERIIGSRL